MRQVHASATESVNEHNTQGLTWYRCPTVLLEVLEAKNRVAGEATHGLHITVRTLNHLSSANLTSGRIGLGTSQWTHAECVAQSAAPENLHVTRRCLHHAHTLGLPRFAQFCSRVCKATGAPFTPFGGLKKRAELRTVCVAFSAIMSDLPTPKARNVVAVQPCKLHAHYHAARKRSGYPRTHSGVCINSFKKSVLFRTCFWGFRCIHPLLCTFSAQRGPGLEQFCLVFAPAHILQPTRIKSESCLLLHGHLKH